MAELEADESIDPAKRREWLEAIRQADPKLLPLLIPTCRAYLALSAQAAQRARGATPQAATSGTAEQQPAPARSSGEAAEPLPPAPLRQNETQLAFVNNNGRPVETPPANSPPGAVMRASYESTRSPADWRTHLAAAIEGLEAGCDVSAHSSRAADEAARLRLLYLAAGRRDDALEPVPSLNATMQDFWSKELFGLATLMDSELISDPSRRTAEAKRSLDEALTRLGEASPLVVRNLAFVRRVDSWGIYEPFEKYEFLPRQKLLLYAEVENFKSNETPKGYHTALRSSYQIFDSRGQRVAAHEFNTSEEYCRNPRHDYFFDYEFSLPETIYPGKYILQLTVADLNNQKIGQSSIEFTIKQAGE